MRRIFALLAVSLVALGACTAGQAESPGPTATPTVEAPATSSSSAIVTTTPTTTTTTTVAPPQPTTSTIITTTTTVPPSLEGVVRRPDGGPIAGVSVSVGDAATTTDDAGRFVLIAQPGEVTFEKPAWLPATRPWRDGALVDVTLHPRVVRALRVSRYVAMERDAFDDLLGLTDTTSVNALVFDTKDETGAVLYDTDVAEAHEIGAVDPMYDVDELLTLAKARGLYTVTRIVTFEDPVRTRARPEAKLALAWIDPTDPANWEYPLALAAEACERGFDEIQFDYVRFPTGRSAELARYPEGFSESDRVETIAGFLSEATRRLHPRGCAVSADIFGIVLSTSDDQGIGQRPEELSTVTDALSPMIYPSHYSPGWLGFADPNSAPGPVTDNALTAGMPRLAPGAIMRPWLQAFYYDGSQVKAQIGEAERRGLGWILWNAGGSYAASWLPADATGGAIADGMR